MEAGVVEVVGMTEVVDGAGVTNPVDGPQSHRAPGSEQVG